MEILIVKNNQTLLNWRHKTIEEKYTENLEKVAKQINSNNKIKKMFVFTLGSLLYCQEIVYANPNLDKIDKAGNMLLGVFQKIGYWICLITCVIEILKNLLQGDTKSVGKSVMKFILAFATLHILPWIFNLIRDVFA